MEAADPGEAVALVNAPKNRRDQVLEPGIAESGVMSHLFVCGSPCDLSTVTGPVTGRYRREIWQMSPAPGKRFIELAAFEFTCDVLQQLGQQG
jgi:hypothetical protein